ncbi:cytochrome P450 [Micromonospora sp. NPDC047467]|uniref:cytochrome P450 n=1 Tax=Micromonospora sp. NPDC047467 TaxID=3154814 RepID=UPI0033ED2DEE
MARLLAPGLRPMWALTRYHDSRAMLNSSQFQFTVDSLTIRPDMPDSGLTYLESMLIDGNVHRRLRRLVASAFTPRHAQRLRPQMALIVAGLLDDLAANAVDGQVDLLEHFARPLPMDVLCGLMGIPASDRALWRSYGAAVSAGEGDRWSDVMPGVLESTRRAIEGRRTDPGADLISDLVRVQADDGDRLNDTEITGLIWLIMVAASTTADFVANAVLALLTHPLQREALRSGVVPMPRAVEELLRWCSLNVFTIPRYAREDLDLHGAPVKAGDPVVAALVAANRDPRVYPDPDRLDFDRPSGTPSSLTFAHGPHICIGAALARVLVEVALTGLQERFPGLASAAEPDGLKRVKDPGTWRLESLPVRLDPAPDQDGRRVDADTTVDER